MFNTNTNILNIPALFQEARTQIYNWSCILLSAYFIKGTSTPHPLHIRIHLADPIDETSGPTALGLPNKVKFYFRNLSKI
jgi:hypothetical protein